MTSHDPKNLQAIVQQAAPELPLTFKPMFGGIMGYADGKPFASLSDMGLALKLTGANHAALLALKGAAALQYAPDQPVSKTYVLVPQKMQTDPDALHGWIVRCVDNLPVAQARKRK